MKELSLYEIRDKALASGRAVFSIQQLANLTGKSKAVCTVYAARLVKKGLARKVLKGKISFYDDEWVIASQLVEPAYISLNSALLFHELITQVPKDIECVTTKNSLKFKNLGIEYHKIPKSLFYGYKKLSKSNTFIMVAEPEKAVLDCLYLNTLSKKDFEDLKNKLDLERMKSLLKNFKGRGSKKLAKVIK